jgi:phosphoserine/homoserine phosphotransferase
MFEVAEKGFFMNAPDKISSSYPDIPSFHNYKDLENAIKLSSHFINE